MNHYTGGNPAFSLYPNQPRIGQGVGNAIVVDDRRSVYSVDSNTSRNPPSISHGAPEAITPAQAYARSVKTGEPYDRTLYQTIERKQPERKTEPQTNPLHLSSLGAGRGSSFAQQLYAGAVKNGPGPLAPSFSSIPIRPSNALGTAASQGSHNIPNRNPSLLPSLFDSRAESPETFNPADLYNSSVAKHGFSPRNSKAPESSSARPLSAYPVSDSASLMSSHRGRPQSRGSYSQPQQSIVQLVEAQSSRPVSYQPPIQPPPLPLPATTVEPPPNRSPAVSPASYTETPSDVSLFPSPAHAGSTIPPLSPPFVEQPADILNVASPPPFEANAIPAISSEATFAEVPSIATVPHQESQLEGSLASHPDTAHDIVPTYSLLDEEQPPPAFDAIHTASNLEPLVETPPAPQPGPEVLPVSSEVTAAPSSSPPPPAPPPPFVSNSKAYPPEKAPAYTLLDPSGETTFVGTSRSARQDTKTQIPPATDRASNLRRPDPPITLSVNSRMLSQSPPLSPLTSPVIAPPFCGTAFSTATPSVPSSPRPASVLSSHSVDSQSTRISNDHFAPPSNINNMPPPPVMYHNKPTLQQARESIMTRAPSMARPVGTQEPQYVDSLTHSMSKMMEGSWPSDTRSLANESGSPARQSTLGPSGSHQVLPSSHPAWAPQTKGSLNRDTYGPEADRLLQEAYQLAHAESVGEMRPGIQGSVPGSPSESYQGYPGPPQTSNPHTTNDLLATQSLSSQHSPSAIPHPGPVPPGYSQEGPQTASVHSTEVGSMFSLLSGAAAPPPSTSHSHRPHTASVPLSLRSPHYSIDRDVHGPVATSGSVPFQPQSFQMPQTSPYTHDSVKHPLGPSAGASALNSNDLARQFALDALLTPAGPPTYTFHGTNRR